jgi:hypothetical protein
LVAPARAFANGGACAGLVEKAFPLNQTVIARFVRAIQFPVLFPQMAKRFFVYIMTNKPWGTIYIGVTSDIEGRVFQHKNGTVEGFTRQYGLKLLVYAEECAGPMSQSIVKSGSRSGQEHGK